MLGVAINAAGIVLGALAGLGFATRLTPVQQQRLRLFVGAVAVYWGFRMTWEAVGGSALHVLKQLGIALLSLSLGNLVGALLRLQRATAALGQIAADKFRTASTGAATPRTPASFMDGILAAALIHCAGPIAIIGSLQQGLSNDWRTLGLKALIDALTTLGFVPALGWSVMLAAVPVVLYQGVWTLAATALAPRIADANLIDAVTASGGLIVACSSLVIFGIRKFPLSNLLPALLIAPLLTAWWR